MDARQRLEECGIKPSAQRLAIMQYLLDHKTHPTVDEIYSALSPSMPTLSRTTVYNTLKLFVDNKVALMLGIEEKSTHFDGDTSLHAHFQCLKCGKIYDIFLNDLPQLGSVNVGQIGNLQIEETEVYYKGYCNNCLNKKRE